MAFDFSEREWELLKGLPVRQIVELAADLEIVAPAEIDRRNLLSLCVPRIVARARVEGLPFSKYDREDLEALPPELLAAIADLQQVRTPSVNNVIRAGERVYRRYQNERPASPVAMCLPMMLTAVARATLEEAIEPR